MSGLHLSRLFRPFDRMAGDQSGVSAIEFALILPLMLSLYLGGQEFGHAFTINRKVTNVTSAIADLVTQSKTITDEDMVNIFDAAASLMEPYSLDELTMRVSLIHIDEDNVATVVWSDASNATPLEVDAEVVIPDDVNTADTYIVTSEAHFDHTPTIGYVISGTIDLWDQFYLRPRQSAAIARPSG